MKAFQKILCIAVSAAMLCVTAGLGVHADGREEGYLYQQCEGLSEGQLSIMKRARQLLEIQWTPIYDRSQWGGDGVFAAGTTYTGVPYGQPVNACYIGYDCTLSGFAAAVENAESLFYTSYSQYNKTAPYYSIDCSGFVSYAWGLPVRKTTATLAQTAVRLEEQSIDALEVGDCLDNTASHAALVGGVLRDGNGNVTAVEILEQTPNIAQHTVFGEGGTKSLDYFINYYFGGGYEIYRYALRDEVQYTHDCAVPIDGDCCDRCSDAPPRAEVITTGEIKTVCLSAAEGSTIYYTTDGSMPDVSSNIYTQPLEFSDSVQLRAIAVSGRFNSSRCLNCSITIEQAAQPVYTLSDGLANGCEVSYGSTVALSTPTVGGVIYYTTDGSDPAQYGAAYVSPIPVTGSLTIRALTMAGGFKTSEEAIYNFTVSDVSCFEDVGAEQWYARAVNYVYTNGLFNGVGEGSFSPDGTMTRGMFITALGRMAGVPETFTGVIGIAAGDDVNVRSGPGTGFGMLSTVNTGDIAEVLSEENGWFRVRVNGVEGYIRSDYLNAYDGCFSDLNLNAYYSPYVQWAYLMGITSGTGSGSFSAERDVTRCDMAVLLYNCTRVLGYELEAVNARTAFTDEGAMGAQAEAVYALQEAGVINGMGDGSFHPDGSATRAQVAQVLMNYLMVVAA